ncbi:hypothetical protein TPA0906_14660 [Streptomyces olivaceus]|nr:hypothetical protein TPA0906_14660 [Streptomyces olivaceus]
MTTSPNVRRLSDRSGSPPPQSVSTPPALSGIQDTSPHVRPLQANPLNSPMVTGGYVYCPLSVPVR